MNKLLDKERKGKQLDTQEEATIKTKKAEAEALYAKAHLLVKETYQAMTETHKKKQTIKSQRSSKDKE